MCKKVNVVQAYIGLIQKICFFFLLLATTMPKNFNNGNKFAIFQYQFTSTVYQTSSVLLNSTNCQKKFRINLHDGDSYTQAEELSRATVYRSQQVYTAEQWLNCKKRQWGMLPLPFSSFPSFSSPFLPSLAAKRLLKNSQGSGSSVSFLSGVMGETPAAQQHTHFGIFLARKSHLAATFFFYKRPKKKQLYRQEVPERRSKIYNNKNFRGIQNFRGWGEFPSPAILEETLSSALTQVCALRRAIVADCMLTCILSCICCTNYDDNEMAIIIIIVIIIFKL